MKRIRTTVLGGLAATAAVAATTLVSGGPVQAAPVPAASTWSFATNVIHVHVRNVPAVKRSKIVETLGAAGTRVTVDCYVAGRPVFGDRIWYHTTVPAKGYIAGFYLRSGHDPAARVPRCPAPPV